jgi:antitoxin component YwqK of YwqJK toxin-antitoxin module
MLQKTLITILLLSSLVISVLAQENREENGMKVGDWAEIDTRGMVYARGSYRDNIRVGKWKFYISPIARFTKVADVMGEYSESGMKTGQWTLIDNTTKMKIIANFENNLPEGEMRYYNENDDLIAKGLMAAGIRHGKWIFYYNNEKMTEGFYKDGVKIDTWVYDYFPEKKVHVKGQFSYTNGIKSGKIEYYRVENHPIFGPDELLSGIGKYTRGRKTGRWIEYKQGLKGQLVETGNYTAVGKRHGYWKTTLGRKNYQAAVYNNGILNGAFKQYHDNGKLAYSTSYQNGFEVGEFTRYYDNGNKEEQGTFEYTTTTDAVTRDTTYFVLKLPIIYHFNLVDVDFQNLNYSYITWINDIGWSIQPAELDRRFALYQNYGRESSRRFTDIDIRTRKVVRTGDYKAFHKNGKLKLEGKYYPKVTEVFDPETNTTIKDFARDGEWKQYDDNGYLMRTIYYDKGNLLKMLDDKGNEMGVNDDNKEEDNRRVEVLRTGDNHNEGEK